MATAIHTRQIVRGVTAIAERPNGSRVGFLPFAQEHPNWSGDRLYETAKAITTAEMVNITYSEFLPNLLGADAIPAYHGYDPSVSPTITEEFEGAA